MWLIWLIVVLAMAIVEVLTTALVTIWFVAGGIGALIATLIGAPTWLQIVIFIVISAISLGIGWKYRDHLLMQRHKTPTNADRLIGQIGILEEGIDPLRSKGRLVIAGQSWRATTTDGTTVPPGTRVKIEALSGVKLVVSPCPDRSSNQPTVE
ncbi:MAG: NfeD family protein [Fastidiosipilaceae bacterium]|jgi:membrane protein implicated in regulation of membrane protease activity|nr:NfeD family protein [Clostridiaceae bacterium]